MYKLVVNLNQPNPTTEERKVLELRWHNEAPHIVHCFGWMVQLGRLKTADYLLRLGILHEDMDAGCIFCGVDLETMDHVPLHCPLVCCGLKSFNWWGIQ